MGLLDMVNDEAKTKVAKDAKVAKDVAQAADKTEKKAGQSYGARQRAKQIEAAEKVRDYLKEKGVDLAPIQESMDILLRTPKPTKEKVGGGAGQTPVLYKMFGDAPKKGDTVTAEQMFMRTFKGFQEIRQQIKKWAQKGIDVEYKSEEKIFVLNSDVEPWKVEA